MPRAASRAIRTGRECLDRELFDDIRIDEGAETERGELEAKHRQQERTQRDRRRKRHLDQSDQSDLSDEPERPAA